MITRLRLEQELRRLCGRDAPHLAGGGGAGAARRPSSAPNPPSMTLRNERFIAAHMM